MFITMALGRYKMLNPWAKILSQGQITKFVNPMDQRLFLNMNAHMEDIEFNL